MELHITHQDSYSRGELILRALFGWLYITIPHFFLLFFLGLWSSILTFISWWTILFTGKYPESFFEYNVKLMRWNLGLSASLYNLVDGYPPFGLNAVNDKIQLEIPYPESLSRGTLLLKSFLGIFYCVLPHGFALYFRMLWTLILGFIAFWTILFTGNYPETWHEFNVGTLRWSYRLNLYISYFMTDEYPPFSGK